MKQIFKRKTPCDNTMTFWVEVLGVVTYSKEKGYDTTQINKCSLEPHTCSYLPCERDCRVCEHYLRELKDFKKIDIQIKGEQE